MNILIGSIRTWESLADYLSGKEFGADYGATQPII
jgi:hypothetical protein